jgi:cytochrome c oxidase subunit 2
MARAQADEQRLWTRAELMERGKSIYDNQCAACHQSDGTGLAPAFPALAGSAVSTGPIDAHIDTVLNGRMGTAMQAWGSLLSASDVAAAVTYTRNAFGNETGDVVQPSTIARIKNG